MIPLEDIPVSIGYRRADGRVRFAYLTPSNCRVQTTGFSLSREQFEVANRAEAHRFAALLGRALREIDAVG